MWLLGPALIATRALAAEPVFVPDFTPGTGDEFAVTVMLQSMVVEQLLHDGFVVLTNDVVGPVVGPSAIASCAVRPGCPSDVMPKVPAPLALVVAITRSGDSLMGSVNLFEPGRPQPVESLFVPIVGGSEQNFALQVSKTARDRLDQLGPSSDDVLLAAARMIAGQTPAAPVPAPVPVPAPAPVPGPAAVPGPPAPVTPADVASALEGTGVSPRYVTGSEANFLKSGEDVRDWMYRTTPHAGRFIFEVRSGIAMGDVDRFARVRVATTGATETDAWYEEGPVAGRRVRGDLYAGYAPATMFDLGLLAGIQYGHRALSTGVDVVDTDGQLVSRQIDDLADIQAISLYLQPRARVYLVPLGPLKPFLFTGFDFRIFDGYHLEQPPSLVYPVPAGGVVPGWLGGGGLMIDPGPIVGFFGEGSYTQHLGALAAPRTYSSSGAWPYDDPTLQTTRQLTVAIVGGVQFRL